MPTTLLDLSPNTIRPACRPMGQPVEAREGAGPGPKPGLPCATGSAGGWLNGWPDMKAGTGWTTEAAGRAQAIAYDTDRATADPLADWVWARAFARAPFLSQALLLAFVSLPQPA